MDKAVSSNMDKLGRRLSAVKVVVDLLNHELDLSKDRTVKLEKVRMEATVSQLELFIEDIEGLLRSGSREDKGVIESSRATTSRVS